MLTAEQQEIRKHGVGASEAPAIVGLDPYKRPIDVYLSKLGLVEDAPSFHTERGEFLEPGLRAWASKRTGVPFAPAATRIHPERTRILASPDGWHRETETSPVRAVLELKSPGPHTADEWGPDGSEDAPARYIVQLAQQMAVTGAPVGYIAALVDGDLRIYRFERDRELEEEVLGRVEVFLRDYVDTKTPPPVDGSPSAREWLAKRFPREIGPMIKAGSEEESLLIELRSKRDVAKALEDELELIEQELKVRIGDAAGIESPFGRVTWKCNKPSLITDWQAVARFLGANKEHELKFTKERPGPRVFRTHFKKEK